MSNIHERKDRMGRVELCVSNQRFQRNACEPVYRTTIFQGYGVAEIDWIALTYY